MSRIGYARVSSYGQSLDVQREKLQSCDRVFQEKQSARSTDKRDQLALCLDYVRDGDFLVITKLDRLARSTRDLLNILNVLDKKQVKLHVLAAARKRVNMAFGTRFLRGRVFSSGNMALAA